MQNTVSYNKSKGNGNFRTEKNRKAAEETVRELGVSEIHWIECGTVITTHGGTGCFGLSGFGKKTSKGRNKM